MTRLYSCTHFFIAMNKLGRKNELHVYNVVLRDEFFSIDVKRHISGAYLCLNGGVATTSLNFKALQ